jgi:hypothetical protein
MSDRELAHELREAQDISRRAPVLREQTSDFNRAIRAGGSWLRAAARRRGMSPEEYQRSLEAEQKQSRDAGGRFVGKDGDEDGGEDEEQTTIGGGFDQGARGGHSKETRDGHKRMNDSIRERAGIDPN